MKKAVKVFLIITAVCAGLAACAAAVFAVMGSSYTGKAAAEKKNLPVHAVAGHRGAAWFAPENTVPAFILGRETGADYLECDVQRTADGKLFIFHDETPERTTDAAEIFPGREKNPIGSFTWDELSR
ncbi:MAG: glycerophosphodiester phosphodiesterase, partial [Spirochaetota bacterium]